MADRWSEVPVSSASEELSDSSESLTPPMSQWQTKQGKRKMQELPPLEVPHSNRAAIICKTCKRAVPENQLVSKKRSKVEIDKTKRMLALRCPNKCYLQKDKKCGECFITDHCDKECAEEYSIKHLVHCTNCGKNLKVVPNSKEARTLCTVRLLRSDKRSYFCNTSCYLLFREE